MVKNLPLISGFNLDQEDPLEKRMAIHSSILAWRIPWTEKPGKLQSTGLQRVRHGKWLTLSLSQTGYDKFFCTKQDFNWLTPRVLAAQILWFSHEIRLKEKREMIHIYVTSLKKWITIKMWNTTFAIHDLETESNLIFESIWTSFLFLWKYLIGHCLNIFKIQKS